MSRLILATMAALAILTFGSIADGQQDERKAPPPSPKINLTMEQEHTIKELMKDHRIEPATVPAPETVGASVPSEVSLQPMPQEIAARVPQIRNHRFFVKDDKIFIVDPKDNSIVEVIDQ